MRSDIVVLLVVFAVLCRLCDFERFGLMMQDRFSQTFVPDSALTTTGPVNTALHLLSSPPNKLVRSPVTPAAPATAPPWTPSQATVEHSPTDTHAATVTATRVLWDIENVAVPRSLGGLETVQRLLSFLRTLGLAGEGVDCRVTAFFNPAGNAVARKVVAQLDHAAVEMVLLVLYLVSIDRSQIPQWSRCMKQLTM